MSNDNETLWRVDKCFQYYNLIIQSTPHFQIPIRLFLGHMLLPIPLVFHQNWQYLGGGGGHCNLSFLNNASLVHSVTLHIIQVCVLSITPSDFDLLIGTVDKAAYCCRISFKVVRNHSISIYS